MMMMKNSVILATCILLFSSIAFTASQSSYSPSKCCFDFYRHRLPKNKVVSFKFTDKQCAMEGVLVTMMSGVEFCADPSVHWVKNIIKDVEAS